MYNNIFGDVMENEKKLQTRKSPRLKDFDYGKAGAYFITICTEHRKNILSSIPTLSSVGEGSPLPQDPCIPKLSYCGKITEKWITEISNKYADITVDCYVIMPNHVHLLLGLISDDGRGDPSPTVETVVGWLKYQVTREINKTRNTVGERVFQRSFHDHIVRSKDDYNEIRKYIHENPLHWQFDRLFSEDIL